MAIRDKNHPQQQAPQQPYQQAAQQTQHGSQQQAQHTQQAGAGFSGFNRASPTSNFLHGGMYAAPIPPAVGSEVYKKLKEKLIDIYKTVDDSLELLLVDLDKASNPNLDFSALVVAGRFKSEPNLGSAFHILLLEGTGEAIPIKSMNTGYGQVELFQVASDAVNERLVTMAHERVKKAFPSGEAYFADATVIPRDFNAEDEVLLYNVALNSGLAVSTLLNTISPNWEDLNLAPIAREVSMEIDISFGRNQRANILGGPMRSDATLNFMTRKGINKNEYELNVGGGNEKRSVISSFVDLLWDPQDPMSYNNFYSNPNMAMQQTQKYVARLVITDLDSVFGYSPGSILLALSTSMALRDRNNWYQLFTPHKGDNKIDIGDIGGLNIEANIGNDPSGIGLALDTKSSSFGLEELGKFLNQTVKQGLMISLDCPEYGPQSWYLNLFVAAANGSGSAYNAIYQAAMELTNNSFASYFPQGTPMFVDVGNRIHLGTWRDSQGVKRDIRDIDHLAVINLMGEKDPKAIRDWSDTFLRTDIPLNRRLAGRRRMIMALTNDSAEFTGYAERVTFSSEFLNALNQGISATKLTVVVNTPLSAQDWNNQRGTAASFAHSALLAPAAHSFAMPTATHNPMGAGSYFGGFRAY